MARSTFLSQLIKHGWHGLSNNQTRRLLKSRRLTFITVCRNLREIPLSTAGCFYCLLLLLLGCCYRCCCCCCCYWYCYYCNCCCCCCSRYCWCWYCRNWFVIVVVVVIVVVLTNVLSLSLNCRADLDFLKIENVTHQSRFKGFKGFTGQKDCVIKKSLSKINKIKPIITHLTCRTPRRDT